VKRSGASPPHRPREDGFTHPADPSRDNLAAALVSIRGGGNAGGVRLHHGDSQPRVQVADCAREEGAERCTMRMTEYAEYWRAHTGAWTLAPPSSRRASPSELLASPSRLSASPSELSASPSELLASPSELSASPSELSASPSELSTSPSELLASPCVVLSTGVLTPALLDGCGVLGPGRGSERHQPLQLSSTLSHSHSPSLPIR
jgi:hypothetical protein